MAANFTIALDAMGGDSAPHIVVEAACAFLKENPHVSFQLYGPQALLKECVENLNFSPAYLARLSILDAQEVITNETKPMVAMRMRRSSMRLAIEAVKEGAAHAVVSAGNTGAYMALSKILLKTMGGIDRPAIATLMPTLKGGSVVLDLGANVGCSPQNLLQFGVLGSVFAKISLNLPNPSVGLLNVGEEDIKGNPVIQEAAQLMRSCEGLNFYGFVEGDDISAGTTDVVVTDGFTGNVVLKAMEGVALWLRTLVGDNLSASMRGRLGYLVAKPAFRAIGKKIDPRLYNGACFLGLQGIAVKSHGGTDAVGFANAIQVALDLVSQNIIEQIKARLTVPEFIPTISEAL